MPFPCSKRKQSFPIINGTKPKFLHNCPQDSLIRSIPNSLPSFSIVSLGHTVWQLAPCCLLHMPSSFLALTLAFANSLPHSFLGHFMPQSMPVCDLQQLSPSLYLFISWCTSQSETIYFFTY